jgi:hypothetical protein
MENIVPAPPSSGFSARAPSRSREASPPTPVLGAALAVLTAFGAVGAITVLGLGMTGALEGPALVLYGAQVSAGVIVVLGFAARILEALSDRDGTP